MGLPAEGKGLPRYNVSSLTHEVKGRRITHVILYLFPEKGGGEPVILRLNWPDLGWLVASLNGNWLMAQLRCRKHSYKGGERCVKCGLHLDVAKGKILVLKAVNRTTGR